MLQIVDGAVEGSPLLARSPQGRHRPARLRPARSAGRVQEGKLHAVPGHASADRGRDRPLSLVAAAGRRRRRRRARPCRRCARRARRRARPPQLNYNDPSARARTSVRGRRRAATAAAVPGSVRRGAADSAARRRRRRADQDGAPGGAEDRPQRSVLVRQREEVQEMSWRLTQLAYSSGRR